MQNPEPLQDAPVRKLPFGKVCPAGFGLFILVHLMPFQLRIRVLLSSDPTAMQGVVVPQKTWLRLLMLSRTRTTDQAVPSHCSMNVRVFDPNVDWKDPIAKHDMASTHDTDLSELFIP